MRAVAAIVEKLKRCARWMVHGRVQKDVDRMAAAVGVEVRLVSGGAHDAFTHAYVSARLTVRLGRRIAELMGSLNERIGSEADGKYLEAAMDKHNNARGREIGARLLEEGRATKEETARSVKQSLDAGDLRVIGRDARGETRLEPSEPSVGL
jgi:hypothetical protein